MHISLSDFLHCVLLRLSSIVTLWVPLYTMTNLLWTRPFSHMWWLRHRAFCEPFHSWELKGNCPSIAENFVSSDFQAVMGFTGSQTSSHMPVFLCMCIYYVFLSSWHFIAPPSVTSPPEESVQAARGATVTFTCQAVGVPTPIITWRLNWGHIPVSGRWVWWQILHPLAFYHLCCN